MKKTYQLPEIRMKEFIPENSLLGDTVSIIRTNLNSSTFVFGGGISSGARAGGSHLWDDDEDDNTGWDQL